MLQPFPPSPGQIDDAVQEALQAAVHEAPTGRTRSHVETIGWGLKRFDRARNALARFEQFNLPGTRFAPDTTAAPGRRIVVFARRLLLWTAAPVEVVEYVEEDRLVRCRIRTLHGHPLRGEEVFVVERLPNGIVRFHIEATATPVARWAVLILPAIRVIQHRFRIRAIQRIRNASGASRSAGR